MLAGGCASDARKRPIIDHPLEYLPQTSTTNVLANMARAYKEMSYEEYRKLLDVSFEYVFAPQDTGGPDSIPGSWGLSDELLSASHLLGHVVNSDGYLADAINVSFTQGPDTPADLNPEWRKVVLSSVNLAVAAREGTSNDPLTYQVIGDEANLYLVQTEETAPGTDLRIWKIIRWEDRPLQYGSAMTKSSTWGLIKAIFH
jgi:hypothetical protein